MSTFERLVMECWCGLGSTEAIDRWAQKELGTSSNPHPNTYDVFGKSPTEATPLLLEIAADRHGFEPFSLAGERLAIEILIEVSERLLDGTTPPETFCHVVRMFDGSFLGLHELTDTTISYPEWLGDLWNACDWCDEHWTLDNSPDLTEEARRMLAENRQRLADQTRPSSPKTS